MKCNLVIRGELPGEHRGMSWVVTEKGRLNDLQAASFMVEQVEQET
jgi:hypothetical protein